MAKRRLLPALRSGNTETKAYGWNSPYGYGAGVTPAVTVLGMKDRAAGWDLDKVIESGYERVVWVFKSVDVIASNAARMPFQITDTNGNVIESHPLLRVMNKRANPHETGREFRKRLSAQLLLSKRGVFVEVTRNNAGQISRLDLLPPDRVRVVPDPGGDYVDYYEFTRYDGQVRNLPPEKVRWIRDPHPLDPFSGVTPLEAAGYSVELDHLARVYNVNFINRDARPGGILGVDAEGLDDTELDRIESRLAPGPYMAGQITAIGTGPGGLNYVDTAAKPRDMAYETTSERAKKEILAAFGVPDTKVGDSSGKTYDNAEQDDFNFWHDTELPHLDLIAQAFDSDLPETLDGGFDLSSVEALELPARRAREEARREWNDGLRTIDEYRPLADLPVLDNAHTRALWISPAKAPVPGKPEDAAALGLGDPNAVPGTPGTPGPGATPPLPPGGGTTPPDAVDPNAPAGPAAQAVAQAEDGSGVAPVEGEATQLVNATEGTDTDLPVDPGAAAAAVEEAMETKDLDVTAQAAPDEPAAYDPGDEDVRRVELAVAAALDAMLARQAGIVQARLESPKTRRGTRYWTPDSAEDARVTEEPIDLARVVDVSRWVAETQQTLTPIIQPAAQEASTGLLTHMAQAGALIAPAAAAVVLGRTLTPPAPPAEAVAKVAGQAAVAPILMALSVAEDAMSDWLEARISELTEAMVRDHAPLATLVDRVRTSWAEKGRSFADSLAVTIAQTAVAGARETAATTLVPHLPPLPAGTDELFDATIPTIFRTWATRDDERVREAHRDAAGQTRELGDPFTVGGFDLRYPSDPFAPPSVSRWCRCWLIYSWTPGSRFTLPETQPVVAEAA